MFLDNLPACTAIDPYDVFKPCHRNALIDTLNKDSNLNHPRYVIASGSRSVCSLLCFRYGAYMSKDRVARFVASNYSR